jgi:hypothetical protein
MATAACQAPSIYGDINYQALIPFNITTRDEFINALVNVIGAVLGTDTPSTVTSLSDIVTLINQKQQAIQALNDQSVIACYQPLGDLSATTDLPVIIQSFQDVLCNIKTALESESDKFVKASASDTTKGYLQDKLVNGANVVITKINSGANEKLLIDAVATSVDPVVGADTATLDVTAINSNTLTANVKIDNTVADNFLVATGAGLFVDPYLLYTYLLNNPVLKSQFCAVCPTTTTTSTTTTTTTLPPTTTTTTSTTTTTTTAAPTTTTTTTTSTSTTTTTPCPCVTFASFNVVSSGSVLMTLCDGTPLLQSFGTGGQLVQYCVRRNSIIAVSAQINNIVYSPTCCTENTTTTSTTTTTTTVQTQFCYNADRYYCVNGVCTFDSTVAVSNPSALVLGRWYSDSGTGAIYLTVSNAPCLGGPIAINVSGAGAGSCSLLCSPVSTTTTTTTSSTDVIYYGTQDTIVTPETFSLSINADADQDITINYGPQPVDKVFYVAYRTTSAAKNSYQDQNYVINAGQIGGISDLYEVRTITYLGEPYHLIITRYPTNFNGTNKIVKYYNS